MLFHAQGLSFSTLPINYLSVGVFYLFQHRSKWRKDAAVGKTVVSSRMILTEAPENDAPIGGLKVITENGWFAARPSGTEDIYKIYAESFQGTDHLIRILEETQTIVGEALASPPQEPKENP